jgi:predicted Zn-dependent peptidase
MFRKFVLDNGLRIVTERMPAIKSVTIGIWVNVGSRDEQRSATQISQEIDALGGEMNAFTGRETTTFYVKVLDQHLKPALTLLSDLFHHSQFDPKEIEKEKQVVLDEFRMVQDDPEDFVQDLHTQQALDQHPLGRPILGQTTTIQRLRRDDLLGYLDAHYHPLETIIAVAGNFDRKELLSLLRRSFGSFTRSNRPQLRRWPPAVSGGLSIHRKPLEQAHLCIGLKGIRLDHKDRYAGHALNAVLGGSVSSRLFQEIREKRGLAYSIYSYAASFSDSGTMTVYAATHPREAARVMELIYGELRRLRRNGLTRRKLARVKDQMKGNLMLSLESTPSRMSKLAKDELYQGRHVPLEEIMVEIDRVSENQVLRLGHELFDPATLSVTALGPLSGRALRSARHS